MRSLILSSLIVSSAFCVYPGTGVVDPATGKNYYVDWHDPNETPTLAICGSLEFNLDSMLVYGSAWPFASDDGQKPCKMVIGGLVSAPDCGGRDKF